MRVTLVITVLVCLAMMSLQTVNSNVVEVQHKRQLVLSKSFNLTSQYKAARRLGVKLPKQICKPARCAGTFIVEQAVSCAMTALMPGSNMVGSALRKGAAVTKKLGLVDKLRQLRHKAADFIIKKLLGLLSCKFKRRMNFITNAAKKIAKTAKKAAKGVSKAAKGVAKFAKKAAKTAKKAAKGVAKAAKKVVKTAKKAAKGAAKAAKTVAKDAKKTAKKAAKGVAKAASAAAKETAKGVKNAGKALSKAAKKLKKGTEKAAKFIKNSTIKSVKLTTKFVKKYGGTILKVACLVLSKFCKPACEAAITAFQSVGVMINSTFHIPVECLSNALRAGCFKLCDVVCQKKRLVIRRMIAPRHQTENKRGQIETWKQKLHDDEKNTYNQKDEFNNEQKEDLNRRRMFVKRVRNEGKQDLPSDKQKFDSINAAANPTQARNEFNNGQKEDLK